MGHAQGSCLGMLVSRAPARFGSRRQGGGAGVPAWEIDGGHPARNAGPPHQEEYPAGRGEAGATKAGIAALDSTPYL